MALLSISAALALAVTSATAEPFGRFGYAPRLVVPGLVFDAEGFKTNHAASDAFKFESKSLIWVVQQTSAYGQIVTLTGANGSPTKVKANLWAEGLELYFRAGIRLRLASTSAPYLTWLEGSVGPGVPTQASKWCLVSFRDAQPPVLFCFQGGMASLMVDGRAGDWVLRTDGAYSGWTRVLAPLGNQPYATNSAKSLGELVNTIKPFLEEWQSPAANLLSETIVDSPTAVELRWTFDRPGAVVPPAVTLGPLGGYGPKTADAMARHPAVTEEGPTDVLKGQTLTLRFPVRRIPAGRAVGLAKPKWDVPATVSAIDPVSLGELALAILTGWSDPPARTAASDALASFLNDSEFVAEPYTGARLPYDEKGHNADLVAAHSLLMQALFSTDSASSSGNSLLTSLAWRRDALNWRFWGADDATTRKVGAYAALAGAICPEPERRLQGAMFETGLAAQRGLSIWLKRRDSKMENQKFLEPWDAMRSALFGQQDSAFADFLRSNLRVYGDTRVWVETEPEGSLRISWRARDTRPSSLVFAASTPLEIRALSGISQSSANQALGFVVFKYTATDAGDCTARIRLPDYAQPLPRAVPPPAFNAPVR